MNQTGVRQYIQDYHLHIYRSILQKNQRHNCRGKKLKHSERFDVKCVLRTVALSLLFTPIGSSVSKMSHFQATRPRSSVPTISLHQLQVITFNEVDPLSVTNRHKTILRLILFDRSILRKSTFTQVIMTTQFFSDNFENET